MKISVNAVEIEFRDNMTVTDLLVEHKVKMPDMVSVELNGNILERKTFETTVLKEGDKVEFLYFMGGGRLSSSGNQEMELEKHGLE